MPRIFKKTRAKLKNDEIEKAFLKKGTIGPSGIVAVYIYFKPKDKNFEKNRQRSRKRPGNSEGRSASNRDRSARSRSQ